MASKETIHPKYRKIKAVTPKGEFDIYSTYSKADKLSFDLFFKDHPAWDKAKKGAIVNVKETAVSNFNKRYSGLDFLGSAAGDSQQSSDESSEK